jgi:hypothetical protein
MPESTIFMTNKMSTLTDLYNLQIIDEVSVSAVLNKGYEFKVIPDISAGTRTINSGAGSATFFPDSICPDALITVIEFSAGDYPRTEQNGYCIDNAKIEVAFFGVPVANSGFTRQKYLNLNINLTTCPS